MEKIKSILYLGDGNPKSNSFYRSKALERLGYKIISINTDDFLNYKYSFILNKIHYRTGYRFLQNIIYNKTKAILESVEDFDLIWVNGGEYFGPKVLQLLKSTNKKIVLYNNDDPTGGRDGKRFDSLLRSLSYYDLCVVMRDLNVAEYKHKGSKNVLRVLMSYDEVAHKAFTDIGKIDDKFKSDIAFIGTYMRHEDRDLFLIKLIDAGLNVSIWGDRWETSKYWHVIKDNYKGKALGGKDYVAAIQGSKICIGMLSKGNRDLHTRRSVEVPYIGGLLCAERTIEHLEMYDDGIDAVFWNDAEECVAICKKLLPDHNLRNSIRIAGMRKIRELEVGNEDICKKIIAYINE
jgi:spore maturation protein CgeB